MTSRYVTTSPFRFTGSKLTPSGWIMVDRDEGDGITFASIDVRADQITMIQALPDNGRFLLHLTTGQTLALEVDPMLRDMELGGGEGDWDDAWMTMRSVLDVVVLQGLGGHGP